MDCSLHFAVFKFLKFALWDKGPTNFRLEKRAILMRVKRRPWNQAAEMTILHDKKGNLNRHTACIVLLLHMSIVVWIPLLAFLLILFLIKVFSLSYKLKFWIFPPITIPFISKYRKDGAPNFFVGKGGEGEDKKINKTKLQITKSSKALEIRLFKVYVVWTFLVFSF